LSIVSAVVQALQGTVALDSRPGYTRFVVDLPASSPSSE
jgi:signal transduction histidine kinase